MNNEVQRLNYLLKVNDRRQIYGITEQNISWGGEVHSGDYVYICKYDRILFEPS